jgi:hypothetical protein
VGRQYGLGGCTDRTAIININNLSVSAASEREINLFRCWIHDRSGSG